LDSDRSSQLPRILSPQQIDEVRRANDSSHDAYRYFSRDNYDAPKTIAEKHKVSPEQCGQWKEPLVPASNNASGHMGSDQTDESDGSDSRYGKAGQSYSQKEKPRNGGS
jgi:hypothetical protein